MLSRNLRRFFSTSPRLWIDPKTVEEVKIPVPWGHIAGKLWGKNKSDELIVAVHGWQDNSGSWDPFAEKLPSDISVFAVDLPGCGLSSWLPPFSNYHFSDNLQILKLISQYFGENPVHLLGHSGGSSVCFIFSCVYSSYVKSYFGIDYLAYAYKNEEKRIQLLSKAIDKTNKLCLKNINQRMCYSWEQTKEKWVSATKGSVSLSSAEILMKRGAQKVSEGKYCFSRDHRVKGLALDSLNVDEMMAMASNVSCPVSLVIGGNSKFFHRGIKHCPQVLDVIKENAPLFEFRSIENGNHHVHMDQPSIVSELYINFLKKVKTLEEMSSRYDYRKSWGRKSADEKYATLVFHGVRDNCASFDRLLPLIANSVPSPVLALDLPSHGLSSPFPKTFLPLHYIDVVRALHHVIGDILFLNNTGVHLIGHSYGSSLAFVYSALFPSTILSYVSLDCARIHMLPMPELLHGELWLATERSLKAFHQPTPTQLTYEEHYRRIAEFRKAKHFPLSPNSYQLLLKRSLIPSPTETNKFINEEDPRLPIFLGRISKSFMRALAAKIKCPILSIRPTLGINTKPELAEEYEHQIEIMKNSSSKLVSCDVEGGHHVHLEEPEKVSSLIVDFYSR